MKKLYNKIMGFVGGIPSDKALHFIAGMCIAALVAVCIPCIADWVILFSIIAGVGREIRDELVYGGFDWKDLIATIAGGLVMQVFIWFGL